MKFFVIIPARLNSTRIKNKPLININGKPMILHVMERAYESNAERVIVATDSEDIFNLIKKEKGEVFLTKESHISGTERIAEIVQKYKFSKDTCIVNLQCDEPFIPYQNIQQVAENLIKNDVFMATLAVPLNTLEDILDPNIVKVVMNTFGHALYFSRSPIPWKNKESIKEVKSEKNIYNKAEFFRHIGIYSYLVDSIIQYVNWKRSDLENIESLEQLRILWNGCRIHVDMARVFPGVSINTEQDLQKILFFANQIK